MFCEQEKQHKAKGQVTCTVGYITNIDIRVKDNEVRECLESKKCAVTSVQNLFHRHSRKHTPIRKVALASSLVLAQAVKTSYPFRLNGKYAFCEEEC